MLTSSKLRKMTFRTKDTLSYYIYLQAVLKDASLVKQILIFWCTGSMPDSGFGIFPGGLRNASLTSPKELWEREHPQA